MIGRTLTAERRRFGYRRLWVLLRREGFGVNRKRVYRLYREEGLSVRRRQRKRMAGVTRVPTPALERPNQRWSMDFVSDALANGRRVRVLTVIDDFTREKPCHRSGHIVARPSREAGVRPTGR